MALPMFSPLHFVSECEAPTNPKIRYLDISVPFINNIEGEIYRRWKQIVGHPSRKPPTGFPLIYENEIYGIFSRSGNRQGRRNARGKGNVKERR